MTAPTTVLDEWQLEIAGLRMGPGTPYRVLIGSLGAGTPDPRVVDTPRPNADGMRFGQDHMGAAVIPLEIGIEAESSPAVMRLLADLRRAWQADATRRRPGAVTELAMRLPGQGVRRVFGRPRRFTPVLDQAVVGWVPVVCEFQCQDHLAYGPEQTLDIPFASASTGGYTVPYTVPLAIATVEQRADLVNVGGDVAAPCRLAIEGPAADALHRPSVDNLGIWSFTLDTTVAYDQTITLDSRIQGSTVLRSPDGANLRGAFTKDSTRLSQLLLYPGENILTLSGTDPSFSSRLRVAWSDAYLLEI